MKKIYLEKEFITKVNFLLSSLHNCKVEENYYTCQ